MRLIVTEKNNSARKIAEILSGGAAEEGSTYRTPYYTWSGEAGDQMTIGLKGHVLNPDFADEELRKKWKWERLPDLIDAPLAKEPTDKNVARAIRKVAKDADSIVIATDYDREGELIGLEALEEILEANPDLASGDGAAPAGGDGTDGGHGDSASPRPPGIKRARYSALTKEEIERAFAELDELSYDLADAGAARQDMDLIWGATLTRAVSLATRRFGSNFLSVGRVQSPTLGLIVERELERRAHVAKPFWEVVARFRGAEGDFEAHHATDKFWEEAEAKAAVANSKSPGTVRKIASRRNTRKPPTPLNTTAFTTDASSRLGITPARAMRIAEDLYMDGFISYPRTDNTVYPRSLPIRELVSSLARIPEFRAAERLLEGDLKPTRGRKETTDHPPIYPTQAIHPGGLDGAHQRVYELIARRFLATFAPPMITESTRADIEAALPEGAGEGTEPQSYFVRGSVVVDPGFAAIYTYARSSDEEIPRLEEGQELELEGVPEMIAKETQPPPRISQGKLIEMMEERGLGTKATRADIIQKLYGRGYVFGNPPEPSATGIAMYAAFKKYVPRMATPEMTAEMEAEMDQIAAGEISKEKVIEDSRRLLRETFGDVDEGKDDLAKEIWKGMDEDRILGPCRVCEEAGRTQEDGSPNMLRIIRARKSGKRFVGCAGWDPDDGADSCDQTFPLPQRGDVFKLEDRCSVCERTPRLQVVPMRGRPWKLCLNDDCPSMAEMKRRRAEREAAKKAKEEAEDSPGADRAPAGAAGGRKRPSPGTARVKRAGGGGKSNGGARERRGATKS